MERYKKCGSIRDIFKTVDSFRYSFKGQFFVSVLDLRCPSFVNWVYVINKESVIKEEKVFFFLICDGCELQGVENSVIRT